MQTSKSVAVTAGRKATGKRKRTKNGSAAKVNLATLHDRLTHRVGLLDKNEILAVVGVSFPTIWLWMREGKFPRSRIVVGKSKWLTTDVADWLAGLPLRPLKGDAVDGVDAATEQKLIEAA
jgi:predicted DNA-binding transcriptional regulator AlpA